MKYNSSTHALISTLLPPTFIPSRNTKKKAMMTRAMNHRKILQGLLLARESQRYAAGRKGMGIGSGV